MTTRPPRLAEWLLERLHRSPDSRYLAGDLAEGFAKRAASDRRVARLWYWSQVLRLIRHRNESRHAVVGSGHATTLRSERWRGHLSALSHDVFAALHGLVRRPGPALVSMLVIALGVTAVAALTAVTYGVLYRPLPWADAERLVRVWETRAGNAAPGLTALSSSYDAWRATASTVDATGAYLEQPTTILGPTGAERVPGALVSANLFPLLGAIPERGRLLVAGDESVVVISTSLAARLFPGRDAIGQPVTISQDVYKVVGVLPREFGFPWPETAVWLPYSWKPYVAPVGPERFDNPRLQVVARLARGASAEQAAAEATASARNAPLLDPGYENLIFGGLGDPTMEVTPLLELQAAQVRPALLALLAGVVLLLLTAVASLAGVQFARTADRRRELAIRAAIGAGRGRLRAQLFAETFWVTALGGTGAAVLTWWLLRAAPALLPGDFPRVEALTFDGVALLAIAVTTLVAGLLIGILPAWQIGRQSLAPTLSDDSQAPVGLGFRSAAGRTRALMIAGQMAVAVLLLVAAGLVGKTLVRLVDEDLGYAPERLLTARLIGVGTDGQTVIDAGTVRQLTARLETIPSVTGIAMSTALPFQRGSGRVSLGFSITGPDGSELPVKASQNDVTPSFFRLMGMSLLEGRFLDESDYGRGSRAFVVNETFARAFLRGDEWLVPFANGGEVVGIVADIKDRGDQGPVDAQIFNLYNTDSVRLARPSAVYLQTAGDPMAVAPLARELVHQIDSHLGLDEVSTMDERLATQVARPRLYATLVTVFAGLSLLIAAVGLFGVLSYAVNRRRREIGVRAALGATPGRLAGAVVRQGLGLALAGTMVGLAAAALTARYLTSLLYQVTPYDPWIFGGVPIALLAIAALACYLPARRAARIDPLTALRSN